MGSLFSRPAESGEIAHLKEISAFLVTFQHISAKSCTNKSNCAAVWCQSCHIRGLTPQRSKHGAER